MGYSENPQRGYLSNGAPDITSDTNIRVSENGDINGNYRYFYIISLKNFCHGQIQNILHITRSVHRM